MTSHSGSENDKKEIAEGRTPVQVEQLHSDTSPVQSSPPQLGHDRFSKNEKWSIVIFTAFVGIFSPLTANIYFPAIPTISKAFNKSTELINLTVTMYMVLQGIAPMLWGPVSDHVGRRPISALCLLILTLSCIGLALTPTSDYWLLMVLRCLQATGSASTIAIGAGVIGDISTRAERGGFVGVFTIGPMLGPSIGPVIGGVLADKLGWRSIFCFEVVPQLMLLHRFQPETLLSISAKNKEDTFLIYKPVIPVIGRGRRKADKIPVRPTQSKIPRNPFGLFLNPDVDALLLISALTCAVFYSFLATISTLFKDTYPFLNETTIGLCFLATGGGVSIGSTVIGRILDMEYQRFKKSAESRLSGTSSKLTVNHEEGIALEQARLRLLPFFSVILGITCAGYGWCIQRKVNIAAPLILHFIGGLVSICIMNASSTMMIDLVPSQSSSVTACNNLIRCILSAVIVSVIELIIKALGTGWTYVIMSSMSFLSVPLIYVAMRIGPRYRVKRQRLKEAEELARIVEPEEKK
ncbi:hypothetical protein CVT25_006299 [Psilocybe cyanescens]|uniref:Major facilitator superfamily (MFS) profile domain-containing protein n=1 Tax=Psilocybe cyanescens TaxID=93625 RepID=A0A409WYL1_PSICY|nr:hypothetical protein CVT25_006299 [Psilocybe cyanescens]